MAFINAGEGSVSHPTQALLDLKTIIDHKNSLDGLKIVIVGDLDHSRVTSSFVEGISNFDIDSLIFSGHPEMCTKYQNPKFGSYEPDMQKALQDADVVMTLRIQYERFDQDLNLDLDTYKNSYQLSSEKLESAKGLLQTQVFQKKVDKSSCMYLNQGLNLDQIFHTEFVMS